MTIYRRPQLTFRISVVLAMVLVISGGFIYGKYSQRWGPPLNLANAAVGLAKLPHEIGDWKQIGEPTINTAVLEELQCTGYVNRIYIDATSGRKVSVAILTGPAGPIAVHTPEICYSSRDYRAPNAREREEIQSSTVTTHTFWSVDFASTYPLSDDMRVYYAWSRGENWEASASPRIEYAGDPLLYKIQVACSLPVGQVDRGSDACRDFLEDFLRLAWKNVAIQ